MISTTWLHLCVCILVVKHGFSDNSKNGKSKKNRNVIENGGSSMDSASNSSVTNPVENSTNISEHVSSDNKNAKQIEPPLQSRTSGEHEKSSNLHSHIETTRGDDASRFRFSINSLNEPASSHFMLAFVMFIAIICVLYLSCHYRKRLMGLIVEGRQNRGRNLRYSRLKNVVIEDTR